MNQRHTSSPEAYKLYYLNQAQQRGDGPSSPFFGGKLFQRGYGQLEDEISLIHPKSYECTIDELDLFTISPTQNSVLKKVDVEFRPLSTLNSNTPIEFSIPGNEDCIRLPHTQLYVAGTIKHKDGTALEANERVAPVNNFLHSLWKQIDVFFGSPRVSNPTNTQSYKAYLETVLNFGTGAKGSQLQTSMWNEDTAGSFDDTRVAAEGTNKGFKKRNDLIKESTEFEMIAPLFVDAFTIRKYLLSFVGMKVKLIPSSPEFCLMSGATGKEYVINLTSAVLKVRKMEIAPHIIMAHEAALMKSPACYTIRRTECKAFTIPGTTPSITKDNVLDGQIPKRFVVGLVRASAVNGHLKQNPFEFKLFGMSSIGVYIDDEHAGGKLMKLKLTANGGHFIEAYQTLFTGTGKFRLDNGNSITRSDYYQGYGLFVVDLTPDGCDSPELLTLRQKGNLTLEIVFDRALTEAINLFCYAEFDNI
ncbi:uncharacterized protein F54H12.2-like [Actinia tenebrosa]|uniref:Uncharacterized protein F54H12.2-like n=1 Tax=Actinia tenebrosa TaxID=6105 RepID=A0A6P8I8V8_ACTTE|nr:uncharacterized protein F54H12.2-like [Actinia tenebrosa]